MTDASLPGFPTEPLLRLNPEGHTAAIRRTDVDRAGDYLVSGADDKTVKVWGLADGSLLRTLRVPQGEGDLGKVYAVAISPDGAEVAVGGFTGRYTGEQILYLFDRATGELKQSIPGLAGVILHLAYAPDGRHLVATLGVANGIRVYQAPDYHEVARDEGYGGSSFWADFDRIGRLVTSCEDGELRLYEGDFSRPARRIEAPSGEPFGVAFSPDGRLIAVGYANVSSVDVLDGETLEHRYSPDTATADNGKLVTVAWAADGEMLLAGGSYTVEDRTPVRRWSQAGRGPFEEWRATPQTVMTLHPLDDGRLVVGASDRVALLDPVGEVVWVQANAMADFRGQRGERGIRSSTSGDRVAFGFEQWGERPALFSLGDLTLSLDPGELEELALPETDPRPGLEVSGWEDTYEPTLNGEPLPLDEFEPSRSFAIAPGGERFVLGTEWALRAFDRDGEPLWELAVAGAVWALNVSGDGRCAVAGYGDGTLRWHRMDDGEELLALYPDPDGRRWVLWTPRGFYQASAGGEDLIGWHLNHGVERAPEFFGASRFRDQFYRPDVIARVLTVGSVEEALRQADAERPSPTPVRAVGAILPPTVTILSPAPGTPVDSQRLALFYEARSGDSPITAIEVRVNGRPARVIEDARRSTGEGERQVVGQISVEILPEDAEVELIAHNEHGASEPATFQADWSGAADYYKPSLYVLAVGVSAYPKESLRLKFAAADAKALLEALQAQEGGLYKAVRTRLLPDGEATRDRIRDGFRWLHREVGDRDVAVVFLSGHGVKDETGSYCYLCIDGDPQEPLYTALGDDDIRKFLGTVAGKTVLLLDTCYSGALRPGKGAMDSLPDIDRFANELADAESGVVVFTSSTGKEISLEDEAWGHGAFTLALLEAVHEGKADFTNNQHVTINELGVYLDDRVKGLTDGRQHPTVTKPKAVPNFVVARVASRH